ncbi:hypothetical protein AUK10_00955 [Candidatus Gracilibacteria bacterium CG2_30_37_12]|nr:MAG: hypothetical protein AUK10_00955 [Candidatus Gracilibacteria bacterium CG2_30_37_12]
MFRDKSNVSKITSTGASSILGTTGTGPNSITRDPAGNIYTANNDGTISKITPIGDSSIYATTGITQLSCITIDSAGNIYTAGIDNNNVIKIIP